MKTFTITSFGCKVNQYESQQLRVLLTSLGLEYTDLKAKPSITVVHTCCVTHIASSKSRQGIRKALKLSPQSHIFVTGCLPNAPQQEYKTIKDLGDNIHLLPRKSDVKQLLTDFIKNSADNRAEKSHKVNNKTDLTAMSNLGPIDNFQGQSRAFLKVQDGCDGHCTYCIIPSIRTDISSRDTDTILAEAKQLVQSGHSEIVLTGIFLGAFGQNTVRRKKWNSPDNPKLAELVEKVALTPNLKRLRLSSLEPGDVTDQLLSVFAKYDNIAPHFHLPLQSGSDNILRKMARQYRRQQYIDIIEKVKATLQTPAITTDIIVGFPGETDEDFQQTVDIAQLTGYLKMHVFSFSARNGTPAAQMPDKVPHELIKIRSKHLQALDAEFSKNYRQKFIGKEVTVIVENQLKQSGKCEYYFDLKLASPQKFAKNQAIKATVNEDLITANVV